jgi:signal transduction histidine kinase
LSSCRELSPSVLSALLKRERIIFTARFLSGEVHNLSSAIQMISLPLSLARLAVEQLDFWRGDLFCKHEVTQKRRLNQVGGYVKVPYVDAALALNSLLANAVDALRGSRGGWLEVRDFEEDGRRGLAVSDSGAGPSPEMAAGLLEPFVGDKGEGHDGLGLYLAAKALEPWGGRLSWRAEAAHTTFVMDFPSS